jgi:hypothetical protein
MRAKNHVIYGDRSTLQRLKEDYQIAGRDCAIRHDRLIVFAVDRQILRKWRERKEERKIRARRKRKRH